MASVPFAAAQQVTPPAQTPTAATTPAQVPNLPRVPTPPTPLSKNTPTTAQLGVPDRNDVKTNVFDTKTRVPGQPQEGEPAEISSLAQALSIAFARNPTVLLAIERIDRTEGQVSAINSGAAPQISAGLTYSQLLNSQSGFGGGAAGSSGTATSPYQVGLQVTPPGSTPVTISSSSSPTTTSSAATTATATAAGTTRAQSGGEGVMGDAGGRQTTNTTTGETTGTTTGNSTNNPVAGGFGGGAPLGQSSARITITQGIDISGLAKNARDIGNIEKALSRLELVRTRQEVALNVRNAYYSVLRSQGFVRVNEAAVAQSTEQLRVTRAQFDAGVAAEFDVIQARTTLENNRQSLITSRNQVNIARNTLANLLGIDPTTPVNAANPDVPAMPELDEAALVAKALSQRAEILQADANILKAGKNILLARRGLLPALSASLNGGYNITQQNFGSEKVTGSIGFALTVPLGDGGATRANVRAARSDERGALIVKDQFVRGVKAEVTQSIIAVRDANERLASTRATVTQAREGLRLANVRYAAGVGTQLEINNAQTQLTQAETNDVNAQYDYLGALARLSRALGNPE